MQAFDLTQAFRRITTHWDPHVAADLNGQQVKLVKLRGEFIWHKHDAEDEMFLVHKGMLQMRFRNKVVDVGAGQFIVVPRGIEHQPFAKDEVELVLFEPAGTLNTGDVRSERTREVLKQL